MFRVHAFCVCLYNPQTSCVIGKLTSFSDLHFFKLKSKGVGIGDPDSFLTFKFWASDLFLVIGK